MRKQMEPGCLPFTFLSDSTGSDRNVRWEAQAVITLGCVERPRSEEILGFLMSAFALLEWRLS